MSPVQLDQLTPEQLSVIRELYVAGLRTPSAVLSATKAASLSTVDHIQTHFYIPETGRPMVLEPFQQIIATIMAGEHSYPTLRPFYTTIEYSTGKKSGKTAFSGAYARARSESRTLKDEILFFANDETQAKGRGYAALRLSIELSPLYDKVHRVLKDEDGNVVWRVTDQELEHVPTGTLVKAVNVDYRGEAGANPTLTVWCVDQETEILTDKGWMTHATFDAQNHRVATRNPKTGAFEWQLARAVNITPFNGSMFVVHGKQIDMSVTPNHRLWASTANYANKDSAGPMHFLHVEEAARKQATYIPDAFTGWLPDHNDELEPELEINGSIYARFMGWYLSEGCTHKDEAVLISQSVAANPDKLETIIQLVKDMGYKPGHWNGADGRADSVVIYDKALVAYCKRFGKQDSRYIPEWLKNSKYISEFLAAYIAGDGHLEVLPNSRLKIGTISKQMADDLQEIGLKLGYWVSSSEYVDPRSLDQVQYTVRLYSGEQGQHAWCVRKPAWTRENYEGVVWCPSTENGIIVVRRNGKVYQTGNTEAWGYDTEKQELLFDEMTPVLTRLNSQRLLEGYAGYTGKSIVLEKVESLLTDEMKGGRQLTLDDIPDWPWPDEELLPLYVNDDAGAFGYIERGLASVRRRMPWLQGERGDRYYSEQRLTLHDPMQFDRLHENKWVSPVDAFIPIEWWDACADASLPQALPVWRRPVPTGIQVCPDIADWEQVLAYTAPSNWEVVGPATPVVLGCDASVSGDCTALVGVTRHPDRHQDAVLRLAWKWDPPRGGKISYEDTRNQHTGLSLKQQIIKACMEYNVVELAYDEWQLHHLMSEFRRDATAWCRPFKQGIERDVADKQLFDLIKTRRLTYNRDADSDSLCLTDIRKHLASASRTVKPKEDTKLHIVKAQSDSKIDLVVALSMATAEALRLDL